MNMRACSISTGFAAWAALVSLLAFDNGHAQSASRGKELFEKRCAGCHALDTEKEGPRLRGVYGRTSGAVSSFTYSDAVKNAHITWDEASLDKWLTDPESLVPKNDMAFQVRVADERADIIAYLKHLSKP